MVHNKAWCVVCLNGCVSHLFGKRSQSKAHIKIGFETGYDFHHFHQWHRVEKVITRKLGGSLQGCSDGRDGKRGGVGYQNRGVRNQVF